MTMTSSRPYLLRALYEWILDNDCTPYILVNAMGEGVDVPDEHVKDGQIVLNISPTAVQNLLIDNDSLSFDGRFAGLARPVFAPINNILGIYARENGQGMIFDSQGLRPGPDGGGDGGNDGGDKPKREAEEKPKKPSLRVVK
jgi:stringent starvation protein B